MGNVPLFLAIAVVTAVPIVRITSERNSDAETAAALLSKASQLTDIRAAGGVPFRLRAQFRLWHDPKRSTEGTYTLFWMAPDRFLEDTNSSIFTNSDLVKANELWRTRSLDYLPLRVWQLQTLLDVSGRLRLAATATRKLRAHSSIKNGIKSTCIESDAEWEKVKICFDGSVPVIVESSIPTETERFEYSNYMTVGDRSFPKELRYYIENRLVVEAKIEELTANVSEDAVVFTPPANAAAHLWCANMSGGTLEPGSFTIPHAKGISTTGGVTVYGLIGPDGKFRKLKVIETFRPDVDEAVLKAVESARLEPATCNGAPTDKDFIVRLTFKP